MNTPALCRLAACFVAVLWGLRLPAQDLPAVTIAWTGAADGNWSNPANWNPGRVPNAADHAAVEGPDGTAVAISAPVSVGSVRVGTTSAGTVVLSIAPGAGLGLGTGARIGSGGRLDLAGSLSGADTAVAGRMVWSAGRIFGGVVVTATGHLDIVGADGHALSSDDGSHPARIENDGVVRWASGEITAWSSARFVNRGQWRLESNGRIAGYCCGGGQAVFSNQGTLLKTVGTDATSFGDLTLEQGGTIAADTGELDVNSNSSWSDGSRVAGTARVRLVGSRHTWTGATQLDGVLELAGGSLAGTARFQGAVPLEWTAGSVLGTLHVGPGSTLAIQRDGGKSFASGDSSNPAWIENEGTVTWRGATVSAWSNSQVDNAGTWRLLDDGVVFEYCCGGNYATFHNSGTLTKTGGTGATRFYTLNVDNSGTVDASSGELDFHFNSVWHDGSRVTGSGAVRMVAGNLTVGGRVTLGGTLDLAGASLFGTARFVGPVPVLWTAGRLFGDFTVDPNATLAITGGGGKAMASGDSSAPARLHVNGTVAWDGGTVSIWDGSVIENLGTLDLKSGGVFLEYCCGGAYGSLVNKGLLRAAAAAPSSVGTVLFSNTGIVQADNSTFSLTFRSTWLDGSQATGTGSTILTGYVDFEGLTTLNGSLQLSGAEIYGNGRLRGPVPLRWNAATLHRALTIEPGTRLEFTGTGNRSFDSGDSANPATLTNRGTVSWTGQPVYAWSGSVIQNQGTWRLEQDGLAMEYCCGGSYPRFVNTGTLVKSGGTGITTINSFILHQRGVISTASGQIAIAGENQWFGGSQTAGLGEIHLVGGTFVGNGLVTLNAPLSISGANVTGQAWFAGPAPLRWEAGRLFSSLLIDTNGTMEIAGPGAFDVASGDSSNPTVVTNRGLVRMTGGTVKAWAGSRAVNEGRWLLETDGEAFSYCCGGTYPSFVNRGEFAKLAGTGTSALAYGTFENHGLLRIASGTLQLPAATFFPEGTSVIRPPALLSGAQTLALGGEIRLEPPAGAPVAKGTAFTLVSAPSQSGTFATTTVPELPGGLHWSIDYAPGSVTANVLDDECLGDSLVGWWPGDGAANDLAGKHPGSVSGALTFADGVVGRAFHFDGAGAYVDFGNWSIGPNWTADAWVRTDAVQPGRRAILGGIAGCRDWGLIAVDGKLGAVFQPPGGCTAALTTPNPVDPGVWHHLAATCDGSTVSLSSTGLSSDPSPAPPTTAGTRTSAWGCRRVAANTSRVPSTKPRCTRAPCTSRKSPRCSRPGCAAAAAVPRSPSPASIPTDRSAPT